MSNETTSPTGEKFCPLLTFTAYHFHAVPDQGALATASQLQLGGKGLPQQAQLRAKLAMAQQNVAVPCQKQLCAWWNREQSTCSVNAAGNGAIALAVQALTEKK